MRLTTWNVNGIRNPFSYPPWNTARTFAAMFDILGSDIVVMQELKIQRKDLRDDMVLIDGWDCYFSLPKHKKGYSGVGIYTRNANCAPIKAEEGLLGVLPSPNGVPYCNLPELESIGGYPDTQQIAELGVDPGALDAEGRCLILEFPAFVLFGVYSPANSNGLRDDFRHGFIRALDCRVRNLIRAGKRVVLVGDLNVSRDESDTASALEDCRKTGVTHEEYISSPNRRIFNQMLIGGEVAGVRDAGREEGVLWDTTRGFHPDRSGMYTHWEQKINARPGNYGSRIDFILVAESMRSWIQNANIQEGLLGSDHCPVFVDFHDQVENFGQGIPLVDIMNPDGVIKDGVRQQEWKAPNVPPFSAKRMPEFDKRRSIKSMFAAPTAVRPQLANQKSPVKQVYDAKELSMTDETAQEANRLASLPSQALKSESPVTASGQRSLKRSASSVSREDFAKRPKLDNSKSASKGQQSLKGFFQSAASPSKPIVPEAESPITIVQSPAVETTKSSQQPADGTTQAIQTPETHDNTQRRPRTAAPSTPEPEATSPTISASPSPSSFSTQLASNEQTQRTWGALFAKPLAPLCESHDEPCKTMQTKKKGSNQGRSFWMCARPLGPSGNKEKGTQWRCGTFIWCSDWGPKREEQKGGP